MLRACSFLLFDVIMKLLWK